MRRRAPRPRVNVQRAIEVRRVGSHYLVGLPVGVEIAPTKDAAERMVRSYCERTADPSAINACIVTWTEVP